MQRNALRCLLQRYRECFPAEAEVAKRIQSLVDAHQDCLLRTCRPGHLTGSAWVVSADGNRHLLLLHKKLGKWLQPGGHADGDPDLVAVARREVAEESGLLSTAVVEPAPGLAAFDLDVHVIPARHDAAGKLVEDAHEHHDVRILLQLQSDEALTLSDESHDLRWCLPDEVRSLSRDPSVLRMLDKALRIQGL